MNETHQLVYGSFSLFSSVVCGVAIALTFSIPKQRKFPNVVLIWICISDLLYALFLAMQRLPGPLGVYLDPPDGTNFCIFKLYFTILLDTQSSVVSVLITLTLYAVIVHQMSLEHLNQYKKWYGAGILLISILFPFVVFVHYHEPPAGPKCSLNLAFSLAFRIAPWIVMFFVQILYIIPVIRYVLVVKSKIKTYPENIPRMLWLYLQFGGIIIARFIFKLITCLYFISLIFHLKMSAALVDAMACTPIFLSVNAIVVIARNNSVRRVLTLSKKLCGYKVQEKRVQKLDEMVPDTV